LNRQIEIKHLDNLKQREQRAAGSIEILIVAKALQYFGKDQIANQDGLFTKDPVEEIRLRGCCAGEIVNPD
jgi:hypothetical protein